MNKPNKHMHDIRPYELGGKRGKQCMTECDQTHKKVGSADCEKNCRSFSAHDIENQRVICWKL